MRRFRMLLLTLAALVGLDLAVAAGLWLADAPAPTRYFDYGRSVPGKIARWRDAPGTAGDLLKVGWRGDITAESARRFAEAPAAPAIRHYGQSFSRNIMAAAQALAPLNVDDHSGPGAPPNYVYALYQDDRANRRPGDVAVIGVLASAVHGLAGYSNMTWGFEQPAPASYPVYAPGPGGLTRRPPAAQRWEDALSPAFLAQLRAEDPHFTAAAFDFRWADRSPFLRLVRRALAKSAIEARKAALTRDPRLAETLRALLAEFVRAARAEGQRPVVLLIQDKPRAVFDLAAAAAPLLTGLGAAFLDTTRFVDPEDRLQFADDGHFLPENDARFAQALLTLLRRD